VPKGVASVAPVASNDTEAGRTRNRRVELVKQ
jgi:flagellar motor protein MotB